jgi:hypothetical protein
MAICHSYSADRRFDPYTAYQYVQQPRINISQMGSGLTPDCGFFATLNDMLTAVSTCFDRWRTPNSSLTEISGIILDAMFNHADRL